MSLILIFHWIIGWIKENDVMLSDKEICYCIEVMGEMYPDAKCELEYASTFQLLCAVILSAQTTDKAVNKVTPALFKAYPNAQSMAEGSIASIENFIKKIGLNHNKAKFLKKCAIDLVELYQGEVPSNEKLLKKLPGVGQKTANVVLSVGFGIPAIAVDTHVERVSKRLGFVPKDATVSQVENKLKEALPRSLWSIAHHRLIFFGRYHCTARSPYCGSCPLKPLCQYDRKNS